MGLSPREFWSMTLFEFNIAYAGWAKIREEDNRANLVATWYNGYFSQINLKKHSLKKWLDDLTPDMEKQAKAEKVAAEGRRLWQLRSRRNQNGKV